MHFWRLAIRPGRPLALGQIGTVPFIGLPGNPVAVLVTFMRFARPAILRLGGCRFIEPSTYRVRTGFPIRKKLGRREWLRVQFEPDTDGNPVVYKFPQDGAGILTSMVASDGLVELPEDLTSLEAGAWWIIYLSTSSYNAVLYFGWVRSRIGHGKEELKLPGDRHRCWVDPLAEIPAETGMHTLLRIPT